MDVSKIENVLLWNSHVHRVPVNAQGPLGIGLSALLLGRSSITLQGIFVLPRVIDADYTGRIYAMIWTPSPPVSIQEGSRIAQLVPFKANVPCKVNQQRGNAGFGSTGLEAQIMWSMEINKTKPSISVELQNAKNRPEKIKLQALVDTGADVMVLSWEDWPVTWELSEMDSKLFGVGGLSKTRQSKYMIQLICQNSVSYIKPYVTNIPMNLIGRDALSQMGCVLSTGDNFVARPLTGNHA